MADVTVVGAGVIGLTVAHELAGAGHRVQVLEASPGVSAVAAALWFPHDVRHTGPVLSSAAVTYERLLRLSADPATGVRMRAGTVLARRTDPDLSWTGAVPRHQRLDDDRVPAGTTGVRCTVPVVVTDVYLGWLRAAVLALGVGFRAAPVTSMPELVDDSDSDVFVVAAGLRSAALLGDDDESYPIRGQIVRLANPGLTEWITDDDNPGGLTYVVPRDEDVVCGGTGEAGSWDEGIDPGTEAAILERVGELVPSLRGRPVLSRAAGLRPARSSVRVEAVPGHPKPVFACYGHGGAGFTLSWGDAARLTRMIDDRV
ncbi:FAD-dependent oxidoreductase [Micromonosporaceae bacterium Da 78-11]